MRGRWAWLVLLSGCERDPTFFGYWEIVSAECEGVVQEDVGFFEVLDDTSMALFLRYTWTGSEFVADPTPAMRFGATSAVEQELFENYQTKGEEHTLTLDLFQATFDVERYVADQARLHAPAATWPDGAPADTTLYLLR